MTRSASEWVELIAGKSDAGESWAQILSALRNMAMQCTRSGQLERATVTPDRILASAAWNLWDEFPAYAPTVVDELKKFWVRPGASGKVVCWRDNENISEIGIISAG